MMPTAVAPMVERPTRRLLGAFALSAIGAGLPWPLLLLLTWQQTHDTRALAVVGAARLVPYITLSWWTSRIGDRWPRGRVVSMTYALRVLAAVLGAVALATHHTTLAVMAYTVLVALGTPTYPAVAAALPAQARDLTAATTCLVTLEVGGYVVGPALGALFLAPSLQPLVPVLTVVLMVGALLVFGRTRLAVAPAEAVGAVDGTEGEDAVGDDAEDLSDAVGMTRFVLGSGVVLRAIAVMVVINFADGVVAIVLAPLSKFVWHEGGTDFGYATAAFGFGALGAPLLGRVGGGTGRRALVGLIGCGTFLALVAPSRSVAMAVAPLALASALSVFVEGATTEVLQEHVPNRMLASVFGLNDATMSVGAIIGVLSAPALVHHLDPRGALIALGLAVVASGVLVRGLGAPSSQVATTHEPSPSVPSVPDLLSADLLAPDAVTVPDEP